MHIRIHHNRSGVPAHSQALLAHLSQVLERQGHPPIRIHITDPPLRKELEDHAKRMRKRAAIEKSERARNAIMQRWRA
jgi:hypothetical protein